jgi:hypothetical protein
VAPFIVPQKHSTGQDIKQEKAAIAVLGLLSIMPESEMAHPCGFGLVSGLYGGGGIWRR